MENFKMEEFLQTISKDKRCLEMFRYLINSSYIRVVNYHNTNPVNAERFEAEIKYYSEHFVPVTLKDLDRFFETRKWPYEKPGLIPGIFPQSLRCDAADSGQISFYRVVLFPKFLYGYPAGRTAAFQRGA